jgi:uncharacterized protein (DUF1330 family)
MSVYVTATYDILDPEGYQGYPPGVLPLLQKHGAQVLAADFGAQALEGQARGVNVLLRFPSEQAARVVRRRGARAGQADPAALDGRRSDRAAAGVRPAGAVTGASP